MSFLRYFSSSSKVGQPQTLFLKAPVLKDSEDCLTFFSTRVTNDDRVFFNALCGSIKMWKNYCINEFLFMIETRQWFIDLLLKYLLHANKLFINWRSSLTRFAAGFFPLSLLKWSRGSKGTPSSWLQSDGNNNPNMLYNDAEISGENLFVTNRSLIPQKESREGEGAIFGKNSFLISSGNLVFLESRLYKISTFCSNGKQK